MKNVLWFLIGVIGGFVVAHFVNKDPRGHELLAEVDARIGEFTDRIGDAYREQEARFAGVIDAARDAAAEVVDSATGAIDIAKTRRRRGLRVGQGCRIRCRRSGAGCGIRSRRRRQERRQAHRLIHARTVPARGGATPLALEEPHTNEDRRDLSALSRLFREERAHDRALRIARHRRPGAAVHGGRHGAVHPVSER